jgi:hypothetical protein
MQQKKTHKFIEILNMESKWTLCFFGIESLTELCWKTEKKKNLFSNFPTNFFHQNKEIKETSNFIQFVNMMKDYSN